MSMLQEVFATIVAADQVFARELYGGTIKVSKATVLANLTVSGTLTGSAFNGGAGITDPLVVDNLLVNQDATVEGTLDAGDTVIIGQTAAQRNSLPASQHSLNNTLQLGPAWRIVSTDNSIDVHFALPPFTTFTKVATLVQLED